MMDPDHQSLDPDPELESPDIPKELKSDFGAGSRGGIVTPLMQTMREGTTSPERHFITLRQPEFTIEVRGVTIPGLESESDFHHFS